MPSTHRFVAEWSPERFTSWAAKVGPATEILIAAVLNSGRVPEQAFRSAMGLLNLAKTVGHDRMEAAALDGEPANAVSEHPNRNTQEPPASRDGRCLRSAPSTDELLAHMAEAEQSARRARSTERLLKRAALRIPASLDVPSFSPERNLDRDLVSRPATMEWVAAGATVLITGPTGAGKSFLAGAFATDACLKGVSPRYVRVTRLFAMLRSARGDGTYFDQITRLAKVLLLVIDLSRPCDYPDSVLPR